MAGTLVACGVSTTAFLQWFVTPYVTRMFVRHTDIVGDAAALEQAIDAVVDADADADEEGDHSKNNDDNNNDINNNNNAGGLVLIAETLDMLGRPKLSALPLSSVREPTARPLVTFSADVVDTRPSVGGGRLDDHLNNALTEAAAAVAAAAASSSSASKPTNVRSFFVHDVNATHRVFDSVRRRSEPVVADEHEDEDEDEDDNDDDADSAVDTDDARGRKN
jgi:hypothetical protein